MRERGDHKQAENIADQDLLREVMNTVGKKDRLGSSIRCVVSVSMLTEGWDANNVTHVLGVRAFGTQLLCEQVIGRALRRQSYDLNEEGLFNVEYADVLGIPFDFTAKPVVAPPQPPRETVHVKAMKPERDHLEIRFPRVQGYRVELPEERLAATFTNDSTLELTPDLVGPSITKNQGIIGEDVDLSLEHLEDMRRSTLLFHITKRLLVTKWRDPGEEPKMHLFGQLKRIAKQWIDNHLVCKGGTYPAQLMYQELADMACERITAAITSAMVGDNPVKAVLDPYNPTGSTAHVSFNTSKQPRWETSSKASHINWVILDSDWEAEFCRVAEAHPKVKAYVKNHNLGFEVPYQYGSETRTYIPDFIVLIDDGQEDPLQLIVEIKGYRGEDAKDKKLTMDNYWIPGVNNINKYGRWAFTEFTEAYQIQVDFEAKVEAEFNKMIDSVCTTSRFNVISYIWQNFGREQKWKDIHERIQSYINSSDKKSVLLEQIEEISSETDSTDNDVLAILALLSSNDAKYLEMEIRKNDSNNQLIANEEFISRLSRWRRDEMSNNDWREWAAQTIVSWVPSLNWRDSNE